MGWIEYLHLKEEANFFTKPGNGARGISMMEGGGAMVLTQDLPKNGGSSIDPHG